MRFIISLIIGLILTTSSRAESASGATEPPKQIFRTLGVGDIMPFTGLRYENKKKSIPVNTPYVDISQPYEKSDASALVLYRETPPVPPETKPTKTPVVTAQLGKDSIYFIILYTTPQIGKPGTGTTVQVIDDSWEAHPLNTVRVLNYSRRRVAIQIDEKMAELSSTEFQVIQYPKNKGIIRCKVATWESDGWHLRSTTPQSIFEGTRSNIVIEDFHPDIDAPNPDGINVFNIVDPLPPPPPPNQLVAGLRPRQQ